MGETILRGDCLDMLPTLAPDSLDACVTDPPYGLAFMGAAWDHPDNVAFTPALWRAVLRVLKPGAHVVAFGGTRKAHRLACAIEDAGFEIRDSLAWIHGQGFPKGDAQLKPAIEPIVLARKPLDGTLIANQARWGTGALNINDCRVDPGTKVPGGGNGKGNYRYGDTGHYTSERERVQPHSLGRWPANVIHDGSDEVIAAFPLRHGAGAARPGKILDVPTAKQPGWGNIGQGPNGARFGDTGSAARFFYCPKPSRAERGTGNDHPTVKPLALIAYLARLITPAGGTILDPFLGSGTTLLAARAEGLGCIGIEREERFAAIAESRIATARTPALTLF